MQRQGRGSARSSGSATARGPRLPPDRKKLTTAGTGSEVTPIAIVTTGETTKMGVVSPYLLPDLRCSMPTWTSAAAGGHRGDRYRRDGACDRELYQQAEEEPLSDLLAREALVLAGGQPGTRGRATVATARRARPCCWAPAWPGRPSPRRWRRCMPWLYPLGGHFHIPHGLSSWCYRRHLLQSPAAAGLYAEPRRCCWATACVRAIATRLPRS